MLRPGDRDNGALCNICACCDSLHPGAGEELSCFVCHVFLTSHKLDPGRLRDLCGHVCKLLFLGAFRVLRNLRSRPVPSACCSCGCVFLNATTFSANAPGSASNSFRVSGSFAPSQPSGRFCLHGVPLGVLLGGCLLGLEGLKFLLEVHEFCVCAFAVSSSFFRFSNSVRLTCCTVPARAG